MAKIRNVSGQSLDVPALGGRAVADHEVVEVPDEDVFSFTASPSVWAPSGKDAQALHDKAEAGEPDPAPGDPLPLAPDTEV